MTFGCLSEAGRCVCRGGRVFNSGFFHHIETSMKVQSKQRCHPGHRAELAASFLSG